MNARRLAALVLCLLLPVAASPGRARGAAEEVAARPAVAPAAAAGVVWHELPRSRRGPLELDGAVWVSPPSACTVEIAVEPGAPEPVAWLVEVDEDGAALARVEQRLVGAGGGRYLLWIPARPGLLLAVEHPGPLTICVPEERPSGRAVVAATRRLWRWAATSRRPRPALPPQLAPLWADLERILDAGASGGGGTDALRRALLLGRLDLLQPGSVYLPRGAGGTGGRWVGVAAGEPVDLDLRGPGIVELRAALAGEAGSSSVPFTLTVADSQGSRPWVLHTGGIPRWPWRSGVRTALRALAIPVPGGRAHWTAALGGGDGVLAVRMVHARPPFPRLPDRVRLPGGATGPAPLPDPDPSPPWPEAEILAMEADQTGASGAQAILRERARRAWLHGSRWSHEVVVPPATAREIAVGLREGHGLAAPDDQGRHRHGVRSFLPPDEDVRVQVPAHPWGDGRWAAVRWLGLNLSGRPAVVSFTVDGGDALRLLLEGPHTPVTIAMAPGPHVVRWSAPDGAGTSLALAGELAPSRGGGPWGEEHPHVRTIDATPVAPASRSGRFELPRGGGAVRLRIEGRWRGTEPRRVAACTPAGCREVVLYPGTREPADVADAGGEPGGDAMMVVARAAVDVPSDTPWVEIEDRGGASTLWVRVAARVPLDPAEEGRPGDVAPPSPAPEDPAAALAAAARGVADAGPSERPGALLDRAEVLLSLGLRGYAEADVAAARSELAIRDADAARARADLVDQQIRLDGDPRWVRVDPAGGSACLPLDLAAAGGPGSAAWIGDLDAGDQAALVAAGDVAAALALASGRGSPEVAVLHGEMARRLEARATADAAAAVGALVHAEEALRRADLAGARAVEARALAATAADALGHAAGAGDRVRATWTAWEGTVGGDAAAVARRAILGQDLPGMQRLLAAGSSWIVETGEGAPRSLVLSGACDDLRGRGPGPPAPCELTVLLGGTEERSWSIPLGGQGHLELPDVTGGAITVVLHPGGRARYAALRLDGADGDWTPPAPTGWVHVARPDRPVRFQVSGPAAIQVRAYPGDGGDLPRVIIDGRGDDDLRWEETGERLVDDRGRSYGPACRARVLLWREGPHELILRADAGPAAVRLSQRVARRGIPPRPPPAPPVADAAEPAPGGALDAPDLGRVLPTEPAGRWPARSSAGTVEAGLWLRQRSSLDQERPGDRESMLEVGARHLWRPSDAPSWWTAGVKGRLRAPLEPAAVVEVGTEHRIVPVAVRLSGDARLWVQDTEIGTRASLALRLRLDRPLRLATGLSLVPYLRVRGFLQPRQDLSDRPEVHREIASRYRAAHPFGLGAGLELAWRPWLDAAGLVAVRAMSNPDPASLDHVGARAELRFFPRPLGVVGGVDVSRRLADEWRSEAWWRTELTLELWIDLGPRALWIRPEIRGAYLVDPARLEAMVGVTVTPGARAVEQHAPRDLLFEDIRGPALIEGRWRR